MPTFPQGDQKFVEHRLSRRTLLTRICGAGSALLLSNCAGQRSTWVDPAFHRTEVDYPSKLARGTIVVDPDSHFLYLVEGGGRALRYGVGVGAEGYGWSGVATVRSRQAWPDWHPTREYLEHHPKLVAAMHPLETGYGMAGGPENPLGARALYLWQGSKDTLYRIHGTNEPWTIGTDVSAGCIRLTNQDIVDLYERVPVGTKVVVQPSKNAPGRGGTA